MSKNLTSVFLLETLGRLNCLQILKFESHLELFFFKLVYSGIFHLVVRLKRLRLLNCHFSSFFNLKHIHFGFLVLLVKHLSLRFQLLNLFASSVVIVLEQGIECVFLNHRGPVLFGLVSRLLDHELKIWNLGVKQFNLFGKVTLDVSCAYLHHLVNQAFWRVKPLDSFHSWNMLQLLAAVSNRLWEIHSEIFIDVEPLLVLVFEQYFSLLHLQFVQLNHLFQKLIRVWRRCVHLFQILQRIWCDWRLRS